jgi:hypothetical protein
MADFDPRNHAAETLGFERPKPSDDPTADTLRNTTILTQVLCRGGLINYIKFVAPWFNVEEIHIAIAHHLEAVAEGHIDRLMVFMSPRAGKSQIASVFFPSWYAGLYPKHKIMQISYKSQLSEGFSRQVRDIIKDPPFRSVFPNVTIKTDQASVGRWAIDGWAEDEEGNADYRHGEYAAAGTTGGIAGTGFNLGIIDDPMSEQDMDSEGALLKVRDWYGPGFYTRRQPEKNAIVLMMTRWRLNDLAGFLLEQERNRPGADQWTVFSIPALLDQAAAVRINQIVEEAIVKHPEIVEYIPDGIRELKGGDSFEPRRMNTKFLLQSKGNMTARSWNALFMQNPVEEEGAILKRKWWRKWPATKNPPQCEFILQCYDTAFEKDEANDPSARTTWGVFAHNDPRDPDDKRYHIILLDRWKERVEFVDLRDECIASEKAFKPNRILIEKRASGHALLQELRRARLPVKAWLPPGVRGATGKIPRAHAAQVVFEQGAVWYMDRNWAEDVINEAAAFPFGGEDDLTDTVTMAVLFLRKTFWVDLGSDTPEDDEDEEPDMTPVFRGYGSG